MSIEKIINLLGLAVVVIGGVASGVIPQEGLIITILGAAGGYYVGAGDRLSFLVTTVAVVAVSSALGSIPAVGGHISAILGNLAALYSASAAAIIIIAAYEKATG